MTPDSEIASLARAQADFARKLFRRNEAPPTAVAGMEAQRAARRFGVYRNNVAAALIETLRRRFPVAERLVGEAFFKAMASQFASENLPASPVLLAYGGEFPEFIASFEPAQSIPYLADVMRLEWLRHAAYHAPDAEPLPPAVLVELPPETLGAVRFQLHPSAGLLTSSYPVVSIWETNNFDVKVRSIGRDAGPEAAIVLRPALEVAVLPLDQGGAAFLAMIIGGASLAEAAVGAAVKDSDFELSRVLGALLAAGAFSGITAAEDSIGMGGLHEKSVFPRR
jgi:hypothetical protein